MIPKPDILTFLKELDIDAKGRCDLYRFTLKSPDVKLIEKLRVGMLPSTAELISLLMLKAKVDEAIDMYFIWLFRTS